MRPELLENDLERLKMDGIFELAESLFSSLNSEGFALIGTILLVSFYLAKTARKEKRND